MDTLLKDISFAFRQLRKHPGFAIVAILTLGLGIGTNSTVFAMVNRVLLNPLPYPEAEQLIVVWDVQPGYAGRPSVSVPEFQDWVREGEYFQALLAQVQTGANLQSEGRAQRVGAVQVAGDYLGVLGLEPSLGRGFTPGEVEASDPVIMVSEAFWESQFAGSPEALGATVELDGVPHTIIGIMPIEAHWIAGPTTVAWTPMSQSRLDQPRGNHFLRVYGRLRSDISMDVARDRTEAMAVALQDSQGTLHGIDLQTLEDHMFGRSRAGLLVLLGAAMAVLLIICGNLASLFLARSVAREQEFAVRSALGAVGGRLSRQLLTETSLVGLLGGALGLTLAMAFTKVLMSTSPEVAAMMVEDWVDGRVVGFTLLVAVGAGMAFGVTPARLLRVQRLGSILRASDGSRSGGGRSALRKRRVMVAGQLAFSVMLLTTSTLLVRGLMAALDDDPGVERAGVLAFRVALPGAAYPDSGATNLFFRQFRERLEGLPGVTHTTVASEIPLSGGGANGTFTIVGRDWPEGEHPYAYKRLIGEDYFETLGIPILRGRGFTEDDGAGTPWVTVISEEMASRHWPDSDPLGARVSVWGAEAEVVGIVAEVSHQGLGIQPRFGTAYIPMAQVGGRSLAWVVLRAEVDPLTLVAPAREVANSLDPGLPLYSVSTMDELVERSVADRRATANLFLAFGLAGLLLAAVGVFGVTAQSVQHRTREIGVRMALGAEGGRMIRMVLREEVMVLGMGLAAGLLMALAVARMVSAGFYQVSPFDPVAYGTTLAVLGGVGLLAVYLPARRAARIDPISALRVD